MIDLSVLERNEDDILHRYGSYSDVDRRNHKEEEEKDLFM